MDIEIGRNIARPITVKIPAEVAFNFDRLVEVQKELFEQLGHGGCYSGADFRFRLVDEWIVRGGELGPVG
jgi:hypothetical protein